MELTEGDVPNLLLFAPKEVIKRVRSQAASSSGPAMRRDLRGSRNFGQAEIKRHRQGLRVDELSSTDVLDVTVFNLGNLARQSIQRQTEPRMLRLIMNQTSHIMMLVEGTSLAVNQWDEKLREEGWTLGSSDDHHHWVGVRTASAGTTVTPLIDNCGSTHQKIRLTRLHGKALPESAFLSLMPPPKKKTKNQENIRILGLVFFTYGWSFVVYG